MLTGYTSRLSLAAGQTLEVMASSDADAIDADVVRLSAGSRRGGPMPDFSETLIEDLGSASGRRQETLVGSHVSCPAVEPTPGAVTIVIRVWPSRLGEGDLQGIGVACGLCLALDESGAPSLLDGGLRPLLRGRSLRLREWHLLIASRSHSGCLMLHQRTISGPEREAMTITGDGEAVASDGITFAAISLATRRQPHSHFDGKLADAMLWTGALGGTQAQEVDDLQLLPPAPYELLASWSFAANPSSETVIDDGPHGLHGAVVNGPARAVTGPRWMTRSPTGAPIPTATPRFTSMVTTLTTPHGSRPSRGPRRRKLGPVSMRSACEPEARSTGSRSLSGRRAAPPRRASRS